MAEGTASIIISLFYGRFTLMTQRIRMSHRDKLEWALHYYYIIDNIIYHEYPDMVNGQKLRLHRPADIYIHYVYRWRWWNIFIYSCIYRYSRFRLIVMAVVAKLPVCHRRWGLGMFCVETEQKNDWRRANEKVCGWRCEQINDELSDYILNMFSFPMGLEGRLTSDERGLDQCKFIVYIHIIQIHKHQAQQRSGSMGNVGLPTNGK